MIHQTQQPTPPSTMPTTVFHLLIVAHVVFDPSWTWQNDQKRTKRFTPSLYYLKIQPQKIGTWKIAPLRLSQIRVKQEFQDVFKFGGGFVLAS